MDRIDIQLMVSRVDARLLVNRKPGQSSAEIAERVVRARQVQRDRFAASGEDIFCNAAMNNRQTELFCPLSPACKALLERLIERMGLSARACSRMIRLARTIADLAAAPDILPEHLSEAAAYRFLDRQNII
jgi:magnesium chelatase family protein